MLTIFAPIGISGGVGFDFRSANISGYIPTSFGSFYTGLNPSGQDTQFALNISGSSIIPPTVVFSAYTYQNDTSSYVNTQYNFGIPTGSAGAKITLSSGRLLLQNIDQTNFPLFSLSAGQVANDSNGYGLYIFGNILSN